MYILIASFLLLVKTLFSCHFKVHIISNFSRYWTETIVIGLLPLLALILLNYGIYVKVCTLIYLMPLCQLRLSCVDYFQGKNIFRKGPLIFNQKGSALTKTNIVHNFFSFLWVIKKVHSKVWIKFWMDGAYNISENFKKWLRKVKWNCG